MVDVESRDVSRIPDPRKDAVDSQDASVPGGERQQAITGLQSAILLQSLRSPQLPQPKLARITLITIKVCKKKIMSWSGHNRKGWQSGMILDTVFQDACKMLCFGSFFCSGILIVRRYRYITYLPSLCNDINLSYWYVC